MSFYASTDKLLRICPKFVEKSSSKEDYQCRNKSKSSTTLKNKKN